MSSSINGRVFSVTVFGNVDVDVLKSAIEDTMPDGTTVFVGDKGVKSYTEQGLKVARARKTGVTVEMAGDGVAKPKKPALKAGPVRVGDEPAETVEDTAEVAG